jgi:hypothetical protein
MADAGLTRGSCYSYFESKGDLYAEAVTDILNEKQLLGGDGTSVSPRAVDNAAQFIRDYLSIEHFEDIEGTCPLIALPTDFLRKEERVRQAFRPSWAPCDHFPCGWRKDGRRPQKSSRGHWTTPNALSEDTDFDWLSVNHFTIITCPLV